MRQILLETGGFYDPAMARNHGRPFRGYPVSVVIFIATEQQHGAGAISELCTHQGVW